MEKGGWMPGRKYGPPEEPQEYAQLWDAIEVERDRLHECALAEERVRGYARRLGTLRETEGAWGIYASERHLTARHCVRLLDLPELDAFHAMLCGDGTPCDPGAPYPVGDTLSGGK